MDNGIVDKATAAIKAADLTPTEHLMLLDFVKEAYEPSLTARVVLDRIREGERSVEETLRVLKEDWHELVAIISHPAPVDAPVRDLVGRRDKWRCRITPNDRKPLDAPEPTFIVPPALSELVGGHKTKHASKSPLDAFMTPSRAARLLSMVSDTSDPGRLANALLFTPSILRAFQNGHVQDDIDEDAGRDELKSGYFMMPIYPEKYEDIVLADRTSFKAHAIDIETEDPKELPLPSPFLLKTHYKFANTLHRFYVEERIAEGWGPLESPSYYSRTTTRIARTIWLLVPKFIRNAYYRHLMDKIKKEYGDNKMLTHTHIFPFNTHAEWSHNKHFNEPITLRLLERHAPSIPAPLLIDTFTYDSRNWLITTALPGLPATQLLHRLFYHERDQLAADLSHAIAQMHKIPNTSPYRFASPSGGPIDDLRFESGGVGPYNSEADLNNDIAGAEEPVLKPEHIWKSLKAEVPSAFTREHESVFTHGALVFNRKPLDGGRLSGIEGWEWAAFMPTYWEYAKAMRAASWHGEPLEIVGKVWGDEFEMEWETEKWLWKVFPWKG
ncbi:hypothetical protein VE02_04776 [Pseudogymnoascus sp. 03VT05]|nr:hypothetical protein VE02_04776 [Pseudogymnoascus sp. 03VT05]